MPDWTQPAREEVRRYFTRVRASLAELILKSTTKGFQKFLARLDLRKVPVSSRHG